MSRGAAQEPEQIGRVERAIAHGLGPALHFTLSGDGCAELLPKSAPECRIGAQLLATSLLCAGEPLTELNRGNPLGRLQAAKFQSRTSSRGRQQDEAPSRDRQHADDSQRDDVA